MPTLRRAAVLRLAFTSEWRALPAPERERLTADAEARVSRRADADPTWFSAGAGEDGWDAFLVCRHADPGAYEAFARDLAEAELFRGGWAEVTDTAFGLARD
jgi:hypothetical protein